MSPWWLTALYVATIIPADLIMATGMLSGLKSRAEARETPRSSGREPLRPELYLASKKPEPGFRVTTGTAPSRSGHLPGTAARESAP
jgi:hypothetical protein